MTTGVLVALVGGLLVALGSWAAMTEVFASPALRRTNLHGRSVPTGGGVVLAVAVVVVAAADRAVATVLSSDSTLIVPRVPTALLVVVLGFGLLGLLDDLLETGEVKGFAGHLRALSRGQVTTGALKLVGGALLALAVAPVRGQDRAVWLVVDAAVIALGANLANLLDRAPGRVIKVTLIVGGAILVLHGSDEAVGLAVVLGTALGLLVPDLREQVMLGDAGANALGAAVAWSFVGVAGPAARVGALVALLALNAVSERVSFSRVIAATPGLRGLDALGRRRAPAEGPRSGGDAG